LTDCFDGFQCGRLIVPLDYTAKNGAEAIIAVQVYPATERDPSKYKGIIMFNPVRQPSISPSSHACMLTLTQGGLGGSGTDSVTEVGSGIAQIVGPEYDIVGFDPRGTGHTLPLAWCFSVEEWTNWAPNEVLSFDRRQDVALYLARSEVVAKKCLAALDGEGEDRNTGPGLFLDTGSVVNDMVEIMNALGQKKMSYLGVSCVCSIRSPHLRLTFTLQLRYRSWPVPYCHASREG